MAEPIADVHEIGRAVRAASDELTARIAALEAEFEAAGLGVAVWVPVSPGAILGYQRHEGKWRIVIRYRLADVPDDERVCALQQASRALRLHAYPHLDKLRPALCAAAADLLLRIHKTLNGELLPNDSRLLGQEDIT